MANSARLSASPQPFVLLVMMTIGTFAVSGFAFSAVINSLPDIFGISMSVTTRSGLTCESFSSASLPLTADSTAKPRSANGV